MVLAGAKRRNACSPGAASGIGRELCRLFGRRRAKIGLVDREKGKLASFAEVKMAGRCHD